MTRMDSSTKLCIVKWGVGKEADFFKEGYWSVSRTVEVQLRVVTEVAGFQLLPSNAFRFAQPSILVYAKVTTCGRPQQFENHVFYEIQNTKLNEKIQ